MPSEEIPEDVKALAQKCRDEFFKADAFLNYRDAIQLLCERAILADRASRQSSLPADRVVEYARKLVPQLKTIQGNEKRSGGMLYHEQSPMAGTIAALDAALSAQPAPPEAELGKHKWVPSTRSYDETICVYCMGTNRELAALGELDYCSKAPAAPPTDAGFNAGIDAAASALEDAWSQDMSMPEALAALNSLRKAQNG